MQVNEIFLIDKYAEAYEYVITNNLIIEEIEPDQFGQRQFQIQKPPAPTEKDFQLEELRSLRNWFDTEYTKQEQKLRRLHTMGLTCDNGAVPYTELINLYTEAETKRKRIQELEGVENGN